MCYVSAHKKTWETYFGLGRTADQCLKDLLGEINCENMRGNYWAKDQEELYRVINLFSAFSITSRAIPMTQFAANRVDRDDAFWQDRLSNKIVDAHLWRPAYTPENVNKIVMLFEAMYPQEDFTWILAYANKFNAQL
jgi:hypothetical protein